MEEQTHEWLGAAMLPRYVLRFLPLQGGRSFARTPNILSAYRGFCIMCLHLRLHWGMVLTAGWKLVKTPLIWRKAILRIGAALICLWGVYAFVRRELGTYLLL